MKPVYLAVLMLATSVVAITAPDSGTKKIAVPRLTQVDAFPEKYRDALHAIGSALSSSGGKPGEYFAEFLGEKDGLWEFHLKHQSHPVDDSQWMGDACSRCRVAFYDPKAGKFLKFQGIK